MNKAILLVRVSTQRQSFDEQMSELYSLALCEGYEEKNIICIAEKESAIKLNEEERNGLNRLKETIENDDEIDSVYVWEISRIARRKKILFSILEYLTKRKIQLVIKEPNIRLLNKDKSINEGSETIFTLFAQLSESEMRNKEARFKRGKEKNANVGKYNGGVVKFGYSIDEKNNYVINDEEANIVRKIFDLYIFENKSQSEIATELKELGLIKIQNSKNFVTKILNSIQYTGYSDLYGFNRIFPIIVEKEIYEAARKKADENKTKSDKGKNVYYCRSIIKCSCGSKYIANNTSMQYICYDRFHQKCKDGIDININLCDSIAWYLAKHLKFAQDVNDYENDNEKYNELIGINDEKILNSKNNLEKLKKKIEKLDYDYYVNSSIPEERYDKFKVIFKEEENDINKNISKWKNENDNYKRIIKINEREIEDFDPKNIHKFIHDIEDKTNTINDDEIRKRIINDYILEINIEEIEKFKKKKIIITDIKNDKSEFIVDVRKKKIYEAYLISYEDFIDVELLEDNEVSRKKYEDSEKHEEIPDFVYFERLKISEKQKELKREAVRKARRNKKIEK